MRFLKPVLSATIVLALSVAFGWFVLEPGANITPPEKHVPQTPVEQLKSLPHGAELADLYELAGSDPDTAEQELDALVNKIDSTLSPLYPVITLRTRARVSQMRGDLHQSLAFSKQILELGKETGHACIESTALHDIAVGNVKLGKLREARRLLHRSLNLASQASCNYMMISIYNVLGVISNIEGQVSTAQYYFHRGLEESEAYPRARVRSLITGNLALVYVQMEEWNKALQYTIKAIEQYHASESKTPESLAVHYLNQALIYTELDRTDEARDSYNRFESVTGGVMSKRVKMVANLTLARLAWHEKDYPQSRKHIAACLNISEAESHPLQYGTCLRFQAKLAIEEQQYTLARSSLAVAMTTFKELDSPLDIIDTLALKAQLEELEHNYYQAYLDLRDYQAYRSDYNMLQKEERFKRQETDYQLRQKQNEIALLKAEKSLAEYQAAQEKIRQKLIMALTAFVLMVLLYQLAQIRKVRRQNDALMSDNTALSEDANRDPLTGLHNRRYATSYLSKLAAEPAGEQLYTLAVLDLDHFKQVNDVYGHQAGDQVLSETANRFSSVLRNSDLLVRWGGEEFLCLFDQGQDPSTVLERLCSVMRVTPVQTEAGEISVSVSAGAISGISSAQLKENREQLISRADQQLYLAKQEGRDRFKWRQGE